MNLKIKNQEMNYYKIGYYKMLKKNVTILILIIKEMIILNYWDNKMYLLFNYQFFNIILFILNYFYTYIIYKINKKFIVESKKIINLIELIYKHLL